MKILLTGHKGMVGRSIKYELELEHELYCFDSGNTFEEWCEDFDAFRNNTLNVMKPGSIDMIIHVGAVTDRGSSIHRIDGLNYNTVIQYANSALNNECKFLFFSSRLAKNPMADGRVCPYAKSKLKSELYLMNWLYHKNLCIFRPYNIWTWHESRKENPSIVYKILTQKLEQVYKGCVRDFVHVSDVVSAVKHVVDDWQSGIFEIGTANGTRVDYLVDQIYSHLPKTPVYEKPPVVECPIQLYDVADLHHLLPGWTPEIREVLDLSKLLVDFMKGTSAG